MKNNQFFEGDFVFYRGYKVKILKIVPHQFDPRTGTVIQQSGFLLNFGDTVFANITELTHTREVNQYL